MKSIARILILGIAAVGPYQASTLHAQEVEKTTADKPVPAAPANSTGEDDVATRFRKRTPIAQPSQEPAKNESAQGKQIPGPPRKAVLTGEDLAGESFMPPHIEANGMQLLQHYGATTGTIKLKSGMSTVVINVSPRPTKDSFPVITLFLERIDGGKFLRIPILSDYEVKSEGEVEKNVEIPSGTYRVTLGFYRSSKSDRAQIEIHSIRFEGTPTEKAT